MGNKWSSIKVESAFQVSNGLSGMNRDVTLRLCILLGNRDKSIRSIFGISQEYVPWKNHRRFENHRKTNIAVSLLRNPKNGCVVRDGPSGIHCSCTFASSDFRTVFIDRTLSEGIFKWTIQVAYDKTSKDITNYFYLGGVVGTLLKQWSEQCLGALEGTASVSFCFGFNGHYKHKVSSAFGYEGLHIAIAEQVADGSLVSLEADCATSTVAFFVGGGKLPFAFSGMRAPLHLGVSGRTYGRGMSFTSISFRRLSSTTPSTIVCKMYKARIRK